MCIYIYIYTYIYIYCINHVYMDNDIIVQSPHLDTQVCCLPVQERHSTLGTNIVRTMIQHIFRAFNIII